MKPFAGDGSIGYGTVPVPTRIVGLLLVGDFALAPSMVGGTLMTPAELDGAPCAAGRVRWRKYIEISCTLERGHTFAGHDLAAGTLVGTYDTRVALVDNGTRCPEAERPYGS